MRGFHGFGDQSGCERYEIGTIQPLEAEGPEMWQEDGRRGYQDDIGAWMHREALQFQLLKQRAGCKKFHQLHRGNSAGHEI